MTWFVLKEHLWMPVVIQSWHRCFLGQKLRRAALLRLWSGEPLQGAFEAQTISIIVCDVNSLSFPSPMSVQGSHLKATATLMASVMFGRVF